jgi:hypothetical protein
MAEDRCAMEGHRAGFDSFHIRFPSLTPMAGKANGAIRQHATSD